MTIWEYMGTFIATFVAVLIGQICAWIIERYIKTHMNKTADYIESKIKKKKLRP